MFALTDYYSSLFQGWLEADRASGDGWNWVLHLAGSDLPWEDMENAQHEENMLNAAPRPDSATRFQNARNLERSSLDPLNSQGSKEFEQLQQQQHQPKTPPLNGRSGSLPKNSDSDADWATTFSDSDADWATTFGSVDGGVQPLDPPSSSSSSSSSMSPYSPGPWSFKGALRKHKETNATHGIMSMWESLSGSVVGGPEVNKKERRVKFCNTAQCVLIPSRSDLWAQGISDLLWFPESVLDQAKREAQEELQKTLASNSSSLSLYAAMNLLYRPCVKTGGRREHFRMLVVDDSTVARRMFIHTIVVGHKQSGTAEHLYVHQADSFKSAMDLIQTHTYNLICVDQYLTDPPVVGQQGSEIIRAAREQYENCVIIGMSSALDAVGENTELGRHTRKLLATAGADIVLRKPIPADTWTQLITCLPMEF